jgi:hypothetical protein
MTKTEQELITKFFEIIVAMREDHIAQLKMIQEETHRIIDMYKKDDERMIELISAGVIKAIDDLNFASQINKNSEKN